MLELAERLGPKARARLGRAAAYYAVLHSEVLSPLYAASLALPHRPQRLAWLRARIEQATQAMGLVLPVAPGSLPPCNEDGTYDDWHRSVGRGWMGLVGVV